MNYFVEQLKLGVNLPLVIRSGINHKIEQLLNANSWRGKAE